MIELAVKRYIFARIQSPHTVGIFEVFWIELGAKVKLYKIRSVYDVQFIINYKIKI